jgi:hypothetical protein
MDLTRGVVSLVWFSASFVLFLTHLIRDIVPYLDYGLRTPEKEPFAWVPVLSKIRIYSKTLWTSMYVVGMACSGAALAYSMESFPLVLVLLFCQTTRRFIECRRVHKFGERLQNSVFMFVSWTFYVGAAVTLLLESRETFAVVWPYSLEDGRAMIGPILFLYSSFLQYSCHRALADVQPVQGKYGVVRGGLFETVYCPHYTAELMIYTSFLIVSPGLPTAGLLCFVVVNLSHSAVVTAEWYKQTFPHSLLPMGRTAIVPYVL